MHHVSMPSHKYLMFRGIRDKAKKFLAGLTNALDNEKLATATMRWPRPVAFFLLVVMFVLGWSNPAGLLAFASALAAFPADFWNVIFILLGSIAGSKGIADIAKILRR